MTTSNLKVPNRTGALSVKGIIVFNDKLLLQLRDDDPKIFYPNHWGFFGGEVESRESPSQAIRRELLEELALFKFDEKFCFAWKSPETGSHLIFFLIQSLQRVETFRLQEGQDMGLFPLEDLRSLRLTPDVTANLRRLELILDANGRATNEASGDLLPK